jgi:hypothetical protein
VFEGLERLDSVTQIRAASGRSDTPRDDGDQVAEQLCEWWSEAARRLPDDARAGTTEAASTCADPGKRGRL